MSITKAIRPLVERLRSRAWWDIQRRQIRSEAADEIELLEAKVDRLRAITKGDYLPCTKWIQYDRKSERWRFNHLEDGHSPNKRPTPSHAAQGAWRNGAWRAEHCWMTNAKPSVVVHFETEEL